MKKKDMYFYFLDFYLKSVVITRCLKKKTSLLSIKYRLNKLHHYSRSVQIRNRNSSPASIGACLWSKIWRTIAIGGLCRRVAGLDPNFQDASVVEVKTVSKIYDAGCWLRSPLHSRSSTDRMQGQAAYCLETHR